MVVELTDIKHRWRGGKLIPLTSNAFILNVRSISLGSKSVDATENSNNNGLNTKR